MALHSMLYAPADDRRKLDGLARSGADAVVADLEDAVAASRKDLARRTLRTFLDEAMQSCPPIWSRVSDRNPRVSAADIATIAHPRLAGIVIPKVEHVDQVISVCDLLAADPQTSETLVMPQIETARGVLLAERTQVWPERVCGLTFGSVDFARDCQVDFDPTHPLVDHARFRLVLASRAAHLPPPIDGPWMQLRDTVGLTADAARGLHHGMGGKSAIHPDQVEPINTAFSFLTSARRSHLELVISRYEAEPDSAALVVDGQFVDEPVYRSAVDQLRRHLSVRP